VRGVAAGGGGAGFLSGAVPSADAGQRLPSPRSSPKRPDVDRNGPISARRRKDGAMPRARSNLSSTRQTVRALRARTAIGPEHAALVALAESTARALDAGIADEDGKKYAVAQLARAHLEAVRALLAMMAGDALDPFAAFVAGLAVPSYGEGPDP
jgi:hypothetical protein